MGNAVDIPMTLRLRGNANALNRTAEQNRRAIRQGPSDTTIRDEAAEACQAQYEAEALANLAAAEELMAASLANSEDPQPPPILPFSRSPPAAGRNRRSD